jgi:hypothetical protein
MITDGEDELDQEAMVLGQDAAGEDRTDEDEEDDTN